MLKKLSFFMAIVSLFNTPANAGYKKKYKILMQNLTVGQPLTPPVIAVHRPNFKLLKIGEMASTGIEKLARDGNTVTLAYELSREWRVVQTKVGKGVTLGGEKKSIIIEVGAKEAHEEDDIIMNGVYPHLEISMVSMLARTNDAILGLNNMTLNLRVGQSTTYFARVYDAGVEENTESCSDIPAPPCGSHNAGNDENSFIRPHAGIFLIGDLKAKRDTFASVVGKITITRMK